MIHAHFGVPMAGGAALHSINTRSDTDTIAFQLDHAESRILIVDREFSAVAAQALAQASVCPLVIDFGDSEYHPDAPYPKGKAIGSLEYAQLLAEGDPECGSVLPADEWDAISLNYTSGTTGNPKCVVCHHRGAALIAVNNVVHAGPDRHRCICGRCRYFTATAGPSSEPFRCRQERRSACVGCGPARSMTPSPITASRICPERRS